MLTSNNCSTTSDLTKSLKIKTTTNPKDHQSKLISKSFSMMNISRDNQSSISPNMGNNNNQDHSYYHGGSSVSVPFIWESQPGTPKHVKLREQISFPPLTPPPSYWHSPVTKRPSQPTNNTNHKSNININIIKPSNFVKAIIFPKKKRFAPSLSPSSSSSTSSRSSSRHYHYSSPPPTPSRVLRAPRGGVVSSPRNNMSLGSRVDEDVEDHGSSPVSTLCFGRISTNSNSRIGSGCYSSLVKVLLN